MSLTAFKHVRGTDWWIVFYTIDGGVFHVAGYSTRKRALEVMLQIAHTQGSCNTFELPEE